MKNYGLFIFSVNLKYKAVNILKKKMKMGSSAKN